MAPIAPTPPSRPAAPVARPLPAPPAPAKTTPVAVVPDAPRTTTAAPAPSPRPAAPTSVSNAAAMRVASLEPVPTLGEVTRKFTDYERRGMIRFGDGAKLGREYLKLSDTEKRMVGRTLAELERLERKEITPAQYFNNMLDHAAQLSRGSSKEYVNLIGMSFSEPNDMETNRELGMNAGRVAMGGGEHGMSGLERIHKVLVPKSDEAAGFRHDICDVKPDSTITHHYGELLQVGYNRRAFIAKAAQDVLDGKENPGDVHNGYFAIMTAQAMREGKLTVDEAVAMTKWAYTNPNAHPPFSLKFDDYDIAIWKQAMSAN